MDRSTPNCWTSRPGGSTTPASGSPSGTGSCRSGGRGAGAASGCGTGPGVAPAPPRPHPSTAPLQGTQPSVFPCGRPRRLPLPGTWTELASPKSGTTDGGTRRRGVRLSEPRRRPSVPPPAPPAPPPLARRGRVRSGRRRVSRPPSVCRRGRVVVEVSWAPRRRRPRTTGPEGDDWRGSSRGCDRRCTACGDDHVHHRPRQPWKTR